MMWVRQLMPGTADLYGPGRTVIIYTVCVGLRVPAVLDDRVVPSRDAVLWRSATRWEHRRRSSGCSARVVYYGRRSGSSMASSQAWSYALTAGAMGFILPGVDNAAHVGGFAGGYLAGRLLDPLKPERIDHVVIAVDLPAGIGVDDPGAASSGPSSRSCR